MDTTDQIAITIDSKVSEKNENNSFQLYNKVLKTLCFTVDENGVRRLKEPICDEICLGKGYKQNSFKYTHLLCNIKTHIFKKIL